MIVRIQARIQPPRKELWISEAIGKGPPVSARRLDSTPSHATIAGQPDDGSHFHQHNATGTSLALAGVMRRTAFDAPQPASRRAPEPTHAFFDFRDALAGVCREEGTDSLMKVI
jgi:hypothetical protein